MVDRYSNLPFYEQQALATHLQIQVPAPDGTLIVVDEGIASLLSALWTFGYNTRFSCQGGKPDSFYNLSPVDEESARGYIYFEDEKMAISVFAIMQDTFPAEEYPMYHIDSRAVLRFAPQAITMFEYALKHFAGDATFGSKDIEDSLARLAFPNQTDAERRLAQQLAELLSASEA